MSISRKRRAFWAGLLFALPWIIGFLLLSAYPIGVSAYNSLTKFNLFQPATFIGLDNFRALFKDPKFYKSLLNTLYITALGTPLNMCFGLALALLLNRPIRGRGVFRTLFYMPTVMPAVALCVLWIWILNPQMGLLNHALSYLGVSKINWLGDPEMTKPALLIMGLWATGNMMVIFLAALQNVPRSLYEAAEIDGAGLVRGFIHITLPGISPVIFFQLIISVINNLQYFAQAYMLIGASSTNIGSNTASGGPENSLLFYSIYLYQTAFVYFEMGKASAMAWIMFFIVAAVTLVIFGTQNRWVTYAQE